MLLPDQRSVYLSPMGELQPGTVFAGHRIETVAGRGGMGVVYRATQLALDRTVALKVIAAGLLEDQTVRARFVRESKIAASIDHPNVIPIYYAGEEDGIAYIAMRYVAGDDVRSLVRRDGPLDPERAARIVAQTGGALDAAHAAGLVHRDIKPANVLLGPDDHAYLTDFGLTKHALSMAGTTKPGHWVGTLDYVAPEQIRGERVDARADVYALGCLLYYTLTGEVPYKREGDEARLWAHLHDPPPKPSAHGVPEVFDDVVARALAKDPEERYPSAGDLGRAARAAAANERPKERERLVAKGAAAPVESPTVSAARPQTTIAPQPRDEAETVLQERSNPGTKRRRALLGVALLAAAGAGLAAAVAFGLGDDPEPTAQATPTPTRDRHRDGHAHRPPARCASRTSSPSAIARTSSAPSGTTSSSAPSASSACASSRRRPARSGPSRPRSASASTTERSDSGRCGSRSGVTTRSSGSISARAARAATRSACRDRPGRWRRPGTRSGSRSSRAKARPTGCSSSIRSQARRSRAWTIPYGIGSLTTSPSALWVAARRRAQIQRVSLQTGQPIKGVPRRQQPQRGHRLQQGLPVGGVAQGRRRLQGADRDHGRDPDQRRPPAAPAGAR